MFTGLVEATGKILAVTDNEGGKRIKISAPFASSLSYGESVAVNGVCLTVVDFAEDGFTADVMPETLRASNLAEVEKGQVVNLERALSLQDHLGGHLVQGHVDGVGKLVTRRRGQRWDELTFSLPTELARYVARKGSITINGVSLTVTEAGEASFGVALIPTTMRETNMGLLEEGDAVNLETDVIAKYVARLGGYDD